jgi:hypothetical protein
VPEYLSDAWITALDAALRRSVAIRELAPFVIEQVVREVPQQGEVRYRVWVDADGGHAGTSSDATDGRPDIRFTTDYKTAIAIARGTENAQTALAGGRLQLGGSLEVLVRHAEALGALDDATADLRSTTTYGDGAA